MNEQVRVQVIFTAETKYGSFTDALYFQFDEYPKLKKKDIESMKEERVNNYIKAIEDAAKAPKLEPTIEDLQATAATLEQQLEQVNSQIREIDPDALVEQIEQKPEDLPVPEKGPVNVIKEAADAPEENIDQEVSSSTTSVVEVESIQPIEETQQDTEAEHQKSEESSENQQTEEVQPEEVKPDDANIDEVTN